MNRPRDTRRSQSSRDLGGHLQQKGTEKRQNKRLSSGDSVVSESANSVVSFSSTKLGRLLAKEGVEIARDFEVPLSSQSAHTASNGRTSRKNMSSQRRSPNKRSSVRRSMDRMGEVLARHNNNVNDNKISAAASSSADTRSMTSAISFSGTVLGQLLAKEGVSTEDDFEVAVKGSKKHLYANLAAPKVTTTSTTAAVASRALPSYPTAVAPTIQEQVLQPRQKDHNDEDEEMFHDEIVFDGDALFMTQLDQQQVVTSASTNTSIRESARSVLDRAHLWSSSCEEEEQDDLYLSEFGKASRKPYKDSVSSSSHWEIDDNGGSNPYAWDEERQRYSDNLHQNAGDEEDDPIPKDPLSRASFLKRSQEWRLWRQFVLAILGMIVVFGILGPLLVMKQDDDDGNSANDRAPSVTTTSTAATPTQHVMTIGEITVPSKPTDATTTTATLGTTAATTAEHSPVSTTPTAVSTVEDTDNEATTHDDRLFHDWSLASMETPVIDYALHPVLPEGSIVNITIGTPYGLGFTLEAPPPVSIHVLNGPDAHFNPGDLGCADYDPVAVVPAGDTTNVLLEHSESSQIVACMNNRVVALATHLFVKSKWEGKERTYHIKVLDMITPHSDRVVEFKPEDRIGFEFVYLWVKTYSNQPWFLRHPDDVDRLNQRWKDDPAFQPACREADLGLVHWLPAVTTNVQMHNMILFQIEHPLTEEWKTVIWTCDNNDKMVLPVGQVFVHAAVNSTTTTTTATTTEPLGGDSAVGGNSTAP